MGAIFWVEFYKSLIINTVKRDCGGVSGHHHNNRDPKPFTWHKTADQILDSIAWFCKRTFDSGH